MRVLAVLVILAAAVLSGCGYAGEPLPPALSRPMRVTDLQAVERGENIAVQFTVPKRTTEDLAIQGSPDIELRVGVVNGSGFDADSWQRNSDRITGIATDQPVAKVSIPVSRYAAKNVVIGVNVRGPRGISAGWSNFVSLPVVRALPKPEGLSASDANDAVTLTWQAAAASFRLYRKTVESAAWERLAEPAKISYSDGAVEYGKTYQYYVETVQKAGTSVAVSEQSDVLTFKPVDRFPPGVPAALSAVAGARGVEVIWERNLEKDLAGYRLYRNGLRVGGDLTAPSYSDQAAQAGAKYQYQVTAVDAAGNESIKSAASEVEVP